MMALFGLKDVDLRHQRADRGNLAAAAPSDKGVVVEVEGTPRDPPV